MANNLFDQFREKLAKDRAHMAGPTGKGGHTVLASETGPAGFALVELLFNIVEAQQKEIDELKARR